MKLISSRYYYSLLNDKDKNIYNEVYKAIIGRKTSIPLKGLKFNKNNLREIMSSINHDNPQLYYVNLNQVALSSSLFSTSLKIDYYYKQSKIIQLDKEIAEILDNIIETEINEYQSEYDKVLKLHDKLKSMAVYDTVAASESPLKSAKNKEAYTIVGMFLNHKCVCEGYTKAMHLLCTMVGIDSIFVVGTGQSDLGSGPHSWNLVKINGYYHHVDITWDRQGEKDSKLSRYGYLNLSDSSIEKDHIWDRSRYPQCNDEPYNYFKMNSAIISSNVELEKFLHNSFMNEEENISFKIEERGSFTSPSYQAFEKIIFGVSAKCKYNKIERYEIGFTENQNVYDLHVFYSEQ